MGSPIFHFEGVSEFMTSLSAMVARVEAVNVTAATKAANIVKKNTQANLTEMSHPKGTPTPSPPGDYPALVTGALRRSISVKMVDAGPMAARAEIGPTIIYGRIQELGGDAGAGYQTHLPPRPYLKPALDRSMPEMATVFYETWGAAIGNL